MKNNKPEMGKGWYQMAREYESEAVEIKDLTIDKFCEMIDQLEKDRIESSKERSIWWTCRSKNTTLKASTSNLDKVLCDDLECTSCGFFKKMIEQ